MINIKKNCKLHLQSRLVIGSEKSLPVVSTLPSNLYFGFNSQIFFGKSISIGPGVNIVVKENGILKIGDGTYFTSDMHIEVLNKLTIGHNCAISWGVTIIDDNHHTFLPVSNKTTNSVSIGDHVWIGCNSTILKGTKIGNNCIVGAGSLVKGTFPDNCLIAGNPAKIIKQGISWK